MHFVQNKLYLNLFLILFSFICSTYFLVQNYCVVMVQTCADVYKQAVRKIERFMAYAAF